ncbi:hypothetical protein ACLB2K_039969 [Fragaria x ananassa]
MKEMGVVPISIEKKYQRGVVWNTPGVIEPNRLRQRTADVADSQPQVGAVKLCRLLTVKRKQNDDLVAQILNKISESEDIRSFSEVCKQWLRVQRLNQTSLRVDVGFPQILLTRFPNLQELRVWEVTKEKPSKEAPLAMSDKGGKGKGKGGKSSLKEATPKGKDDGSAKSKKTRNVQFSSQGSIFPLYSQLFHISVSCMSLSSSIFNISAAASTKANSGKGGQADGGAKKDKEPLQLKVENELPKGAKCLMDCEAADILQGIQDHMVILSKDPSIKLPV